MDNKVRSSSYLIAKATAALRHCSGSGGGGSNLLLVM